jgi:hypothetical protein
MNRDVKVGDIIGNRLHEEENEFTGMIISVEKIYAGGFDGTVIKGNKRYPLGYNVTNWNPGGRHWDLVEEPVKDLEVW